MGPRSPGSLRRSSRRLPPRLPGPVSPRRLPPRRPRPPSPSPLLPRSLPRPRSPSSPLPSLRRPLRLSPPLRRRPHRPPPSPRHLPLRLPRPLSRLPPPRLLRPPRGQRLPQLLRPPSRRRLRSASRLRRGLCPPPRRARRWLRRSGLRPPSSLVRSMVRACPAGLEARRVAGRVAREDTAAVPEARAVRVAVLVAQEGMVAVRAVRVAALAGRGRALCVPPGAWVRPRVNRART